MSKRFIKPPIPYREQSRLIQNFVADPRVVLSATKRTNHAPIMFEQQIPGSQGHVMYRNKESRSSKVHGDESLELVKLVREQASTRPKPYASLTNAPGILPVRRSLLALAERKPTVVRDQLSPQKPPGSRLQFLRSRVQHVPGLSTTDR